MKMNRTAMTPCSLQLVLGRRRPLLNPRISWDTAVSGTVVGLCVGDLRIWAVYYDKTQKKSDYRCVETKEGKDTYNKTIH